ncbi:GAF domain-containing protein [Modestobacter lapidis]|nr:GAF domain-containing protein [Modestobacter lapidis]
MDSGATLAERFRAALSEQATPEALPELLPQRLSRAVARVLPVDGVGISVRVDPDRHFPLGASDAHSGLAERLQFTVGAGPCLQASEARQPVFVVAQDMARRWPAFHDLLLSRTPYRGIVALPLRRGLAGAGAIDLYFRRADEVPVLDVFAAMTIGDLVTATLAEAAVWSSWEETDGPRWLQSPSARHRAGVWRAMSMTSLALGVETDEALAVLRAQAYARGRTVDDLAADVVDGRLDPREVFGDGATEPR